MVWFEPRQVKIKSGETILLRCANPYDARDVLQLSYDVISENDTLITKASEMQVTEQQQRDYIEMYNESLGNVMIVAYHNHNLIGLLTFQRGIPAKVAHQGTIGMIVRNNWRSKGVGKELLANLILWAEQQSFIEKICLEVLSTNERAIGLYKHFGFIEEGRQNKQVKLSEGNYCDLVIMGKIL